VSASVAAALLERADGSNGGKVAVFQSRLGVWEQVSWVALAGMAERIGNAILAKGVKPDDVVAIIADNSVEFLAVQYGVVGAGAAAFLIPPDYSPETTAALLAAHHVVLAIAGDEEQFDKCIGASQPPPTVIAIETRGLRELEIAGRPDRGTRSTLTQAIDDAGAVSSWRSSVGEVSPTSRALLVTSIVDTDVVISSLTHMALLAAGQSSLDTLTITANSRLLAQRSLAELDEQVLSVAASLLCGCPVAIGEGGPLGGAELAQVAPTHLHVAPNWLGGLHADASQRVSETKGLKRFALGGRVPTGSPSSVLHSRSGPPASRLIGLGTFVAVFLFLLVSPSMNDWIRIVLSAVIAAVGGVLYLRTPAAVHGAIKCRYGLGSCSAVIGEAAKLAPGSAEFLAGLGIALVGSVGASTHPAGRVASSVLAERQRATQ
jgi:non-ribosomal peptide synthetase component F